MEEYNDDLYYERKNYYMAQLQKLLAEVNVGSIEDCDAFDNAMSDFDD